MLNSFDRFKEVITLVLCLIRCGEGGSLDQKSPGSCVCGCGGQRDIKGPDYVGICVGGVGRLNWMC